MRAVVIPTYRARATILRVLSEMPADIGLIVVVDDCCPDSSGELVRETCTDERVLVVRHEVNKGVGGAFLTGMVIAIDRGASVIVKVDSDGQMDPSLIPALVRPIELHQADYVKGNRFYFLSDSRSMPRARRFGNLVLSFMTKVSSGYWNLMDPTNGFFAIEARVGALLPRDKISQRFFFESDLLFHLGLVRAKVADFPMQAVYGDEVSNLNPARVIAPFFAKHVRNCFWRILYKYFLRDFSLASVQLVLGSLLMGFGLINALISWFSSYSTGVLVPTGTIMLISLSLIFGFQLLLSVLNYDVASVPRDALHPMLPDRRTAEGQVGRQTAPGASRLPAGTSSAGG